MPGTQYSSEIRDRIHHLSSMGFSGIEISHLLAIPPSSVSRIVRKEPHVEADDSQAGRHRKLSRADVEVSRAHSGLWIFTWLK
jgi:hypothetical protein